MSNARISRWSLVDSYWDLTNLVQHLVTLVKNENLNTSQSQVLVANQRVQTSGSSDNDVGVLVLVLEDLNILLHGRTSVEHGGLDVRHVLAESGIFVLDLVCQFTGVTHDKDGGLSRDRVDLLESGEDEDGSLSKTRLGLAEDVCSQDRLRDTNLLN